MTNANDSAFPLIGNGGKIHDGLTKKEYFAAMCLQGLCAVPDKGSFDSWEDAYNGVAKTAVNFADALINELNK